MNPGLRTQRAGPLSGVERGESPMRLRIATADTVPMFRRLILAFSALVLVGLIGAAIWYDSTQPSRVERIVACVDGLGYSAYWYHDDGVEPLTGQDPDILVLLGGSMQVRPPSDHVIVNHRYGTADVTVPSKNVALTVVDNGDPLKSGERAAIIACTA
jgi:ABC-type amino acid transport substrate-binding protein